MGPELIGVTDRHGTRWRISAFPLGGYVRFVGDRNAASTPDASVLAELPETDRKASFAGRPLLARAAIVAAGPLFNFLFAMLAFAALAYFYGETTIVSRVGNVLPNTAAERAGFQKGDIVESIDGEHVDSFLDIFRIVSFSAGDMLTIVVKREGREITLTATPTLTTVKTAVGPQRFGQLGIAVSDDPNDLKITRRDLVQSLGFGVSECWGVVSRTAAYVSRVFAGRAPADQLSGPLGIAHISKVAASFGFATLLNLAALLSVSLGLLNILPVPMLDGGHLLFYLVEGVRGRPLSERAQEYGLRIGLALLLMLAIFATFNDILRLAVS
jgi:regulator of sigma E protease